MWTERVSEIGDEMRDEEMRSLGKHDEAWDYVWVESSAVQRLVGREGCEMKRPGWEDWERWWVGGEVR
jgi:hypothetical protein